MLDECGYRLSLQAFGCMLHGCDGVVVGLDCGVRCFFFQAEDGIRVLVRSRGLGDVYKRQVTALVPIIGYETAASLAKEALVSDRTIRELIIDKGLLSKVELEKILDPRAMIHPGVSKTKNTKKIH